MSTEKPKKRAKGQWLSILAYLLIGAACGLLIPQYVEHRYGGDVSLAALLGWFAVLLACVYAAMLIQIVIHEAGHLVFGLATGYRFSSFRILSLMWLKENGKIRLTRLSLAGTGGQCLMSPPELKDGKMPVMLYNFGGALMNVIASLIFLVLALLCPAWSLGQVVLLELAIIGFAYALMNGLPLGTGPVNNDGRNALDISRSPAAMRAFWIQMKVNELTARGVRVKDMPREWFTMPSDEEMRNGIIATIGALSCSRLMDEQRFEEAEQQMAHILSRENGVAGLHRALMTCDRMYVELVGQNRREVLDRMMSDDQQKIMKAMKRFPSVLRTEYALALLSDRNAEKAEAVRAQFDKTARTYPYPSEIAGERELMDIAAKRAEQPAALQAEAGR